MPNICQEDRRGGRCPNKETLRHLYWQEGVSAVAIAELFSVTRQAVLARMKKFQIPRRPISTSMKLFHAKNPGAQKGLNSNAWKGGRVQGPRGYIFAWAPNHPGANPGGYVLEHRLVAEKKLGQPLPKEAVVHHLNGIKDDNRPENLEIFKDNSSHVKFHAKEKH